MNKKVAFITGASSGIGFSTAQIFLDNDYIVCNASRRPALDDRIINYTVDVSDTATIDKAVDSIINEYGRIDILINCAGYSMAAPIEEVEDADYKYLFDVNLFGPIHTIKAVIPIMRANGYGRIINVSSIGSVSPIPYDPYYCASKAALDMLSVTLNTELNPYNITVSSILPGGTRTDFTYSRKIYDKGSKLKRATRTLSRIEQHGMTPQAVAQSIYKLAISKNPKIISTCGLMNKVKCGALRILPKKTVINLSKSIFKTNP